MHSSPVARPYHAYSFSGKGAGLYDKIGLDPEFLFISGSAATLQLLISGDAHIGNIGILEFISSKKKQPTLPLSVVYSPTTTAAPAVTDCASRTAHPGAWPTSRARRVGVLSLAAGTVPTLKAMAREAGIDPGSIQFVAVGADAAAMVALKAGRVDAYSHFIGAIAGLENLGMKLRSFAPDVASGVFVTSNALLANNRDLVVRGLQGIALSTPVCAAQSRGRGAQLLCDVPAADRRRGAGAAQRCPRHREDAEHLQAAERRPPLGRDDRSRVEQADRLLGPEFGLKPEDTRFADFFNGSLIADVNKVDIALAESRRQDRARAMTMAATAAVQSPALAVSGVG